jgi:hypothetical protein
MSAVKELAKRYERTKIGVCSLRDGRGTEEGGGKEYDKHRAS